MKKLASVLITGLILVFNNASAQEPPETVPHVDLDRYVGTWYEIARLPNRFQSHCAGNVTAQYEKREDGRIDVVNRCKKEDGTWDEAKGVARVADKQTKAKLEVRFAPSWLSWLPMVWGDYWILDLAPDYSYSAVGDPKRENLWILSRTPQLPDKVYQALAAHLATQGYDVTQLNKTRQDKSAQADAK